MSDAWVDAIYEASGLLVGPEQGRAIGAMIAARVEAARREEREACAMVAVRRSDLWAACDTPSPVVRAHDAEARAIAAAIRARGGA